MARTFYKSGAGLYEVRLREHTLLFRVLGDNEVELVVSKKGEELAKEQLSQNSAKLISDALDTARFHAQWIAKEPSKCRYCGEETKHIRRGEPGHYECRSCNYEYTR